MIILAIKRNNSTFNDNYDIINTVNLDFIKKVTGTYFFDRTYYDALL